MLHIGFEQNIDYRLSALAVLVVFYGIYFLKMYNQKKRGICTNQIGRRKEKTLHMVEILMSAATCLIAVLQLASIFLNINCMPPNARFTGVITGTAGDAIFLAAVLCMGNSWRAGIPKEDKTAFVKSGIYAYSRNPAFLGFDLMYIGVFLMYANIFTGIFTVFAILMLHLQILQEEKYLTAVFGKEYLEYKSRVCRYLGRKR